MAISISMCVCKRVGIGVGENVFQSVRVDSVDKELGGKGWDIKVRTEKKSQKEKKSGKGDENVMQLEKSEKQE